MDCAESRQNSLVQQIEPVLQATTSGGGVFDNPSEDALFMLFDDITGGDVDFFIVERLDDASGQTYAQTIRDDDELGLWNDAKVLPTPTSGQCFRTSGLPTLRSLIGHTASRRWISRSGSRSHLARPSPEPDASALRCHEIAAPTRRHS